MIPIQTPRLSLRLWRETDFDAFAAYFADVQQTAFLGGTKSREQAWRLMAAYIGHWYLRGYSYLAIEEKASAQLVGCVGLWNSEPWPELELGYWLLSDMQGKGYATEAANGMKNFAFTQLQASTLVSYIDPNNQASMAVATRLGGVKETLQDLLDFGPHWVYRYAN